MAQYDTDSLLAELNSIIRGEDSEPMLEFDIDESGIITGLSDTELNDMFNSFESDFEVIPEISIAPTQEAQPPPQVIDVETQPQRPTSAAGLKPEAEKPKNSAANMQEDSETTIRNLNVQIYGRQNRGSRPDSVYYGSFLLPYMEGAIKTSTVYYDILSNAASFLRGISPFNKISQFLTIHLKSPVFTYLSTTGIVYGISAKNIPRPLNRDIPEPMPSGLAYVNIVLSITIDVEPKPEKPVRKTVKRKIEDELNEEVDKSIFSRLGPKDSADEFPPLKPSVHRKFPYRRDPRPSTQAASPASSPRTRSPAPSRPRPNFPKVKFPRFEKTMYEDSDE